MPPTRNHCPTCGVTSAVVATGLTTFACGYRDANRHGVAASRCKTPTGVRAELEGLRQRIRYLEDGLTADTSTDRHEHDTWELFA
jgi:hypothetical protein